jgi:hypothetical protein
MTFAAFVPERAGMLGRALRVADLQLVEHDQGTATAERLRCARSVRPATVAAYGLLVANRDRITTRPPGGRHVRHWLMTKHGFGRTTATRALAELHRESLLTADGRVVTDHERRQLGPLVDSADEDPAGSPWVGAVHRGSGQVNAPNWQVAHPAAPRHPVSVCTSQGQRGPTRRGVERGHGAARRLADPFERTCPTCFAPPWRSCRTEGDQRVHGYHRARGVTIPHIWSATRAAASVEAVEAAELVAPPGQLFAGPRPAPHPRLMACPTCHAPPGVRCVTITGKPVRAHGSHRTRDPAAGMAPRVISGRAGEPPYLMMVSNRR